MLHVILKISRRFRENFQRKLGDSYLAEHLYSGYSEESLRYPVYQMTTWSLAKTLRVKILHLLVSRKALNKCLWPYGAFDPLKGHLLERGWNPH